MKISKGKIIFQTRLQAFKLFDADGDGLISAEELTSLISKVIGGERVT